ncbi:MAG: prepilin peptidase [Candidatus Dojkabacteria bacterium]|jgi:prepilin signal peptidase PulO-like enzyme (type II secretory pathway)|nr:prepilin peptidase [Candidatus Dojkabacteria bacterium]
MAKLLNWKYLFIFLYLLFLSFVFYKGFSSFDFSLFSILEIIFLILISGGLFYLSYYDFIKMEVHNLLSLVIMLLLLLINIALYRIYGLDSSTVLFGGYIFNPLSNLIGAIILGGIFQLVVLLSKEKALGQGDVRIAIMVGLLIGQVNLIAWLYITIFSSLFYGLIMVREKKKIRGLHIPFVPFMILGVLSMFCWFLF